MFVVVQFRWRAAYDHTMESAEYHSAAALLRWQVELGATEAICDGPVDRYSLGAARAADGRAAEASVPVSVSAAPVAVSAVEHARSAAQGAVSLDGLRDAMAGFDHCAIKRGARSLVFSGGIAGARVMIIGAAPDRDEDREGKPFVGRAGQLLDQMLAAIGMGRASDAAPVYITNVMPWRPPQDRDPLPEEIAMMQPFLHRHVALARPDVLVLMGNISCQAVLGKRGITRLRGQWSEAWGLPVLPMYHPADLLRNRAAKRDAWADLLSLKAWLRG